MTEKLSLQELNEQIREYRMAIAHGEYIEGFNMLIKNSNIINYLSIGELKFSYENGFREMIPTKEIGRLKSIIKKTIFGEDVI